MKTRLGIILFVTITLSLLLFVSCDSIIDSPQNLGTIPEAPFGLAVTNQSFDSISLNWYVQSGVDSFIIYQS